MTDFETVGVLRDVSMERRRQTARWGQQDHSPLQWLAILTEELGEVARPVADMRIDSFDRANYREELIQVAAVAVAAVEAFDRDDARRAKR